jgi:glycine cleavage system H protein
MNIPQDLKYTKEHEWISQDGKIGITEYAQGELGDIVFIDINQNLSEIVQGSNFGTIEAVKTVSELYAPVDGKVLEINSKISQTPEIANSDPYGEGWMIKIEITNPSQMESLLDASAYAQLIGQ